MKEFKLKLRDECPVCKGLRPKSQVLIFEGYVANEEKDPQGRWDKWLSSSVLDMDSRYRITVEKIK